MAKLIRVTGKVFGATADSSGNNPEIGQFGSAKAGTYNGTGDVATIQSLPAWDNGWIDAVTPTQQYPALPEMTGVHKVLSHQSSYILQEGIPEYDAATTYYANSICKGLDANNNLVLYKSLIDNNTGNALTDTTKWEELKFGGGGSRLIGEIVMSTIPLSDAGLHLLDGSLLLGNGVYADFVTYIAGLYNSGDYDDIFDTEANWQTAVTTYGVCGKFVYDNVNNTVRLPKITGFTEGTIDPTTVGDLVEAGLPNIEGTFTGVDMGAGITSATGAFKDSTSSGTGQSYGSSGTNPTIDFDASNSNSTYGNSNTVQPQSIKVLYYIVVATTTKTDIQVDIDEVITDLNAKVDKDQCVDLAPIVPEYVIPSYTNGVSKTSGTQYTATQNGLIVIGSTNDGTRLTVEIVINGTTVAYTDIVTSNFTSRSTVSAFVKKGQTYTATKNGGGSYYFYPIG